MNKELISISKAILATLLYVIITQTLGLWIYVFEAIEIDNYNLYYKYFGLIQSTLILIVVLIFTYYRKKRTFKNLIKRTSYKWYLSSLILGVSFSFIQTPLKMVYNFIFQTDYQFIFKYIGFSEIYNINLIYIVLLSPIIYELFFRDYVLNNLHKNMNNILAILIASILFAYTNSPYTNLFFNSPQDLYLSYITFFGGALSCIIYLKSKSIGPPIIYHMVGNLTVVIFSL